MPERYRTVRRAIIVGGGPGGLTAAIALRHAGFDITVCERAARLGAVGSGLTLWPNATRALDELGLLPALRQISRPLTRIAMNNWRGRVIFEDELAPVDGRGRFPAVGLLRTELVELLARPVADAILTNVRVSGLRISPGAVVARLADGRELMADVLIGADGLHSSVRAHFVTPDPLVYAGYTVWRGMATLGFATASATTWMGPASQFGLFPLAGARAYWFASRKSDRDGRAGAAGPRAEVSTAFADWPDPIPRVVRASADEFIVRTDIYDRQPLRRWSFGRVALLGDAAHPAEPTLGQGACQAIEDGVVLGACLADNGDVIDGLRRYESRRLQRANGFVLEARRIGKIGLWDRKGACWVRDRMIGALPAPIRQRQLARMFAFAV